MPLITVFVFFYGFTSRIELHMGYTRNTAIHRTQQEGGMIDLGMGQTLETIRDRREKERQDGHDMTLVDAIRRYLMLFDAI